MKITKIPFILLVITAFMTTSCDSFLDKNPDDRTESKGDDTEKLASMLTSAYPDKTFAFITELMSDNVDNIGDGNPYTDRFFDEFYTWKDVTETTNDSPLRYWTSAYSAIANANMVIDAVDQPHKGADPKITECKGEALIARAYNHFMLVNVFCKPYNAKTSQNDLGIPYMTKPSSELLPSADRGTVDKVYELIEKDLVEGLKLIGDGHYTVPKYHFNEQASYAFAARFYLYYEKWDKAVEYATKCIGTNPAAILRDWQYMATLPQGDAGRQALEEHYVSSSVKANLLLNANISSLGLVFNPYNMYSKYAHTNYICTNETAEAPNVWGDNDYYNPMRKYSGSNLEMAIFWKYPMLFEILDPIAETGYRRVITVLFSADEALLNRAEAYVMLKQYDKAVADLNLWAKNILKKPKTFTAEDVQKHYNAAEYSYSDPNHLKSTIKKHLHPAFAIDAEGSMQETMLQCVLGIRRIETLHTGMRWFDIRRYGIEIPRRTYSSNGTPAKVTDVLKLDDPRRCVQIPADIVIAGLQPNPSK